MADFKDMTVQALRDLARKMLGAGHSRLKTKAELVEALEAADRKVAGAAAKVREATERAAKATEKAAARVGQAVREVAKGVKVAGRGEAVGKRPTPAVKKPATAPVKEAPPAKAAKIEPAAKKAEPAAKRAPAADAVKAPPTPAKIAAAESPAKIAAAESPAPEPATMSTPEATPATREADAGAAALEGARRAAEAARLEEEGASLDPEGYFVARVRGEEGLRAAPHPMTEAADTGRAPEQRAHLEHRPAPAYDEGLGELPWSYGDNVFLALPRDPKTLYLYWDYSRETLARAFSGLGDARTQIWLYTRRGGGQIDRIRAIDFQIESRSYYVHDLDPGQLYRAEVHVIDRAGRDRLLAATSNEVLLPRFGPSSVIDDRFARIPWDLHLLRWRKDEHPGSPFSAEARAHLARLSDWSRFAGAVWGSGSASGVNAGGMGGRPSSALGAPGSPFTAPSSPWPQASRGEDS